jgi:hypothetical protein
VAVQAGKRTSQTSLGEGRAEYVRDLGGSWQVRRKEVLLVSGLPATGKTTFGQYLAEKHGFQHYHLEGRVQHWPYQACLSAYVGFLFRCYSNPKNSGDQKAHLRNGQSKSAHLTSAASISAFNPSINCWALGPQGGSLASGLIALASACMGRPPTSSPLTLPCRLC